MKKIEAVIRPLKLDEVKIALGEIGVTGMSVSDVRGVGSSPPPFDLPRSRSTSGDMPIRTKIEVVARDEDVDEIVSIIEKYARTGEAGDGKVFVLPMADAIRVRTEERGETVL
jgi:nitrogen regulatory protein P-II 1